jgi:hypothetical protein
MLQKVHRFSRLKVNNKKISFNWEKHQIETERFHSFIVNKYKSQENAIFSILGKVAFHLKHYLSQTLTS